MELRKILLVSLGHLSCDVNGGALPALLPFLRTEYGLSYQAAGGLMFAYSCLSSVIQPVFGYLADKISKPWFISLGVLLAGCGIAAIGFFNVYWAIFAAVAMSGVGAALFHPEGARYANKVSGRAQGVGLSIFSVGGNSGFALGPLIAVAAVHAWGMKGTAVFGVIAVLMAFILLIPLRRMAAISAGRPAGARPEDGTGSNNWREFSKLTGAIVVRSILFVGFNTFIPLYWVQGFGQSGAAGAMALAGFAACGVISNFAGGVLSDRYGYRTIIRVAYALLIPSVALFGLTRNLSVACVLVPLLAFALYAPFSSMVVMGQTLLSRNIGFASGVTMGLSTSMGGLFAPVLGKIADLYGLAAAIHAMAALSVLGALFALALASSGSRAGR
ncbi:MAG: MFS transporter [Desulfovibrionaceae bacterium]|nr:MFS transporter [Desulfovibrionaceae bacterium]